MGMGLPRIEGVFVAAVTPLTVDDQPDLAALPALLRFYAGRGCHGALLLGTTGEGPSISAQERAAIFTSAQAIRDDVPGFLLLAGTGTPSLPETISITQAAFRADFDGVVVLPPYYFRDASEEGLFNWFSRVMEAAVPEGKSLIGYHIPKVSGVPLSLDLLARLKTAHPSKFAGIKDSSSDADHARALGQRFGRGLQVFTGNDRLFDLALENQASGCITAPANLFSPELRRIWEAHAAGRIDSLATKRLSDGRAILDKYPPAAPTLKAILSAHFAFPAWSVRPPLIPLPDQSLKEVLQDLDAAGLLAAEAGKSSK